MEDKKPARTLDIGRGCEFTGPEGEESGVKICEGCQKLHVTDWLAEYPSSNNDIFEIRFKNTRRGYYQNANGLDLKVGDIVAVEASPGHDIGIVSLSGDMVGRQMRRVGFNPANGEFKKIYRKAKPYDIEKWQEAMAMEHETMIRSRQIAADMNLNMKIGDVEYQGDKIKAIFYYIADERVDFRELIKVFAEEFHIRVEMKQIGARQEAGRIGGLGACGRELCCASWISGFTSVTTNAARAQEISLNPQKLAGQCSKLKCCMIYEYDDYMDARKEFPRLHGPLYTMDGEYHHFKNDILAHTMSFSTAPSSMAGLVTLPIERVAEVIELNARGVKPDRLEDAATMAPKEVEPNFINMVGEDSITRFDREKRNRGKKPHRDGREVRQFRDGGRDSGAGTPEGKRERSGNERRLDGGDRRQSDDQRRPDNDQRRHNNDERPQNGSRRGPNGEDRREVPRRGGEGNRSRNLTAPESRPERVAESRQGRTEGNRDARPRNDRADNNSGAGKPRNPRPERAAGNNRAERVSDNRNEKVAGEMLSAGPAAKDRPERATGDRRPERAAANNPPRRGNGNDRSQKSNDNDRQKAAPEGNRSENRPDSK